MPSTKNTAAWSIIVDSREQQIHAKHKDILAEVSYGVSQIPVGDFIIARTPPDGGSALDSKNVYLCIERKTLVDASASIKDGRWANREKMFELRAQTGCVIMYIIEGPLRSASAPADELIGGIRYSQIESSLIHMMLCDDVRVMWTHDSEQTARLLVRLVKSISTINSRRREIPGASSSKSATAAPEEVDTGTNPGALTISGGSSGNVRGITAGIGQHRPGDQADAPTLSHALAASNITKPTPFSIMSAMWATMPRVTVESAPKFMALGPLYLLLTEPKLFAALQPPRGCSRAGLQNIVESKKPSQHAVAMLTCVPGVSKKAAQAIVSAIGVEGLNKAANIYTAAKGVEGVRITHSVAKLIETCFTTQQE